MNIFKTTLFATAAAAIMAIAGAASAATVSGTCGGGGQGEKFISLFSVEANTSSYVLCDVKDKDDPSFPDYSGTPMLSAFGMNFSLAYKSVGDVGSAQEKGDNAHAFASFTTGSNGIGTWALNDAPSATIKFLVGLKQGTTYAAFLVNAKSGTWFTANSASSDPKAEVSHYDLWYAGRVTPPSAVPLPAAGWLLIAALGGLVVAKRRKSA